MELQYDEGHFYLYVTTLFFLPACVSVCVCLSMLGLGLAVSVFLSVCFNMADTLAAASHRWQQDAALLFILCIVVVF